MVFKEQDVVAPHNTSSQTVQQKSCECLFSSSYVYFLLESPWPQGSSEREQLKYPAPETKGRSFSQSVIIPRAGSTTAIPITSSGSPKYHQSITSAALPLPLLPPFNPISFPTAALPPQAFSPVLLHLHSPG